MRRIRIIPRLDVKGPNVVKGVQLEGLRVLGRPEEFARHYYSCGADELMFMDVVASLYGRNSLHEIISRTAREVFVPLNVGGGLRSLDDIAQTLRAGADKVSLNTAAIRNPEIIRQAALRFGSSTIVVVIEASKQPDGSYVAYTDNGREFTGVDALAWAKRVEELGAGEIVITSVDREGTGRGYDVDLVRRIADNADIPVVAHGGAGCCKDVQQVIHEGHADAVAVASILHYSYLERHSSAAASAVEGNVEFLKQSRRSTPFETATLDDIKRCLKEAGIECRSCK